MLYVQPEHLVVVLDSGEAWRTEVGRAALEYSEAPVAEVTDRDSL